MAAHPLEKKIAAELRRHQMLPSGDLALVAVSGGADSVALLMALHSLGCRLHVAHLHHGIRGWEADGDAEFVAELCERLGVPWTAARRDVPAFARERKLSLETAAREARHAFLRDTAAELGASAIFLAHTADDQVETFLLRLIRGAGLAGLAAMRPKDGLLCRPMLGIWRSEIEAYLTARGQSWREDATNRDRRFLRNRVRHELLPLLASMNPGVKKVLLREAEHLGARQRELDAELYRRLGLGSRQIDAALAGKAVVLKGGRRLEPFEAQLAVPGEVTLPGVGKLSATLARQTGQARCFEGEGSQTEEARLEGEGSFTEFVDGGRVGPSLRVRNRRPGDRFVPLGMRASKKLQDFLVDEKVPRAERDRLPLVAAGSAIVWVVGRRIDERFKVTADTTRVVRLQFEPA